MATTKVALLASNDENRESLQGTLEKLGLQVVLSKAPSNDFLEQLTQSQAQVLLIDIDESVETEDDDLIDDIAVSTDVPVLFNDSSAAGVSIAGSSDTWARKLAGKLQDLADSDGDFKPAPAQAPLPIANAQPKIVAPVLQPVEEPFRRAGEVLDLNVWVLGASLGGPQAVRQFLNAIDEDLPVAFILAQHIGANHVALLAEQLNRVTKFKVISGKSGHRIQHGEVILTPADKQITFTADGFLALQPAAAGTVYSPSIDNVMQEVAKHFGNKSGTIIFSGMGDDGARGCEAIAEAGGLVWAQDIASCVVSSMPDQARKTGKVSYSAHPEQLAQHLYEHYQ